MGKSLPVPRVSPRLVKTSRVALVIADPHEHIYFTPVQVQARPLLESASFQPPTQQVHKLSPSSPPLLLLSRRLPRETYSQDKHTTIHQHNSAITMSAIRQIVFVSQTVARPAAKTHVRRLSSSVSSGGPPPVSSEEGICLVILRCASDAPSFPPCVYAYDPLH